MIEITSSRTKHRNIMLLSASTDMVTCDTRRRIRVPRYNNILLLKVIWHLARHTLSNIARDFVAMTTVLAIMAIARFVYSFCWHVFRPRQDSVMRAISLLLLVKTTLSISSVLSTMIVANVFSVDTQIVSPQSCIAFTRSLSKRHLHLLLVHAS